MKYPWIDDYLMAKRSVTKDLQSDWNWIRYHIGGKMFAAILLDDDDRPYYINLKLDPVEGDMMRQQFPDIIPGYYSNKQHWNSVKADGEVPDEVLKALLDRSYQLVLHSLGKQKQRDVLGVSCCGTDCPSCTLHGTVCAGCNETCGKVFHMTDGKACPIYACCVNRRRYASCAECDHIPCELWRATRDPSMSDETFEQNIRGRVELLSVLFGKQGLDWVPTEQKTHDSPQII